MGSALLPGAAVLWVLHMQQLCEGCREQILVYLNAHVARRDPCQRPCLRLCFVNACKDLCVAAGPSSRVSRERHQDVWATAISNILRLAECMHQSCIPLNVTRHPLSSKLTERPGRSVVPVTAAPVATQPSPPCRSHCVRFPAFMLSLRTKPVRHSC